jgi:hypothetical protein
VKPQTIPKFLFFLLAIVGSIGVYLLASGLRLIASEFTAFMSYFISIAAALAMLAYATLVFYVALFGAPSDPLRGLFNAPLVTVGLPTAIVASMALVTLLPLTTSSNEPLEIDGLSLKIKGPAAQIVLWAMCFIVILGGMVAAAALGPRKP